jgi:transcriptional regulator with XRE-family HTH domain
VTPLQLKLARTALDLSIRDLAKLADVAPSTITRFESGNGGTQRRTLEHIQKKLEDQGVIFFDADASGGPGVRLKS